MLGWVALGMSRCRCKCRRRTTMGSWNTYEGIGNCHRSQRYTTRGTLAWGGGKSKIQICTGTATYSTGTYSGLCIRNGLYPIGSQRDKNARCRTCSIRRRPYTWAPCKTTGTSL